MIVCLGPDTWKTTFLASKFTVVSFAFALNLFQRNNSYFRGENKN